jgi:hypothetical protein
MRRAGDAVTDDKAPGDGTPDHELPGRTPVESTAAGRTPAAPTPGNEPGGHEAPRDAERGDGAPEGERSGGGGGGQYQAIGFTFALLGLVLLLGTDSRAAGLPLLVIGIAFLVLGRRGGARRSRQEGEERD